MQLCQATRPITKFGTLTNGFLDGILIVNAPLDSPKVVNIKVNYETANIFAQPICRLFFLYANGGKSHENY